MRQVTVTRQFISPPRPGDEPDTLQFDHDDDSVPGSAVADNGIKLATQHLEGKQGTYTATVRLK